MRLATVTLTGLAPLFVLACNAGTPSPAAICEHIEEIVDETFSEREMEGCVEGFETELREECPDTYDELVRCAMRADNEDDLDRCEELCDGL